MLAPWLSTDTSVPRTKARMSETEREYRKRLGQWSGQQRVARSAALFEEVRDMLRRRIAASDPDLDERAIRRRIAESLYRTDRQTQALLALLDR